MSVELFVPEAFMGEVIGDLNARNGKVESITPKPGIQVIKAVVPLARMFGYSTALRSSTQGRGTRFVARVPASVTTTQGLILEVGPYHF